MFFVSRGGQIVDVFFRFFVQENPFEAPGLPGEQTKTQANTVQNHPDMLAKSEKHMYFEGFWSHPSHEFVVGNRLLT